MTMPASRMNRTVVLLLAALLLTACGESAGKSSQAGDELAAAATKQEEASTPASESTPISTESNPTAVAHAPESPIDIASAPAGETISKEIPAGSVPTAVPISRESNFDSDGDGYYTYDELVRAVESVMPNYDFPSNYQVTLDTLMAGMKPFADSDGKWQVPMELAVLGNAHRCA